MFRCYIDAFGNMPCDNGAMCDRCNYEDVDIVINPDGVAFVNCEDQADQYLVKVFCDHGCDASLETAAWIIDWLDMEDCYPDDMNLEVWDISGEEPRRVTLFGTWHNFDDPLYIKGEVDGKIVFDGYGTDH